MHNYKCLEQFASTSWPGEYVTDDDGNKTAHHPNSLTVVDKNFLNQMVQGNGG